MKSVILIDGGYLRSVSGSANLTYDPDFIEAFAKKCGDPADGEILQRVLYYDCPQYRGKHRQPVSGTMRTFTATDNWLDDLASRDLFAVRRGTLAFRGWAPRNIPIAGQTLSDSDFKPTFEQKGVDMRIGLDIASMSNEGKIERILLVSGDTDLIAAAKHARKAGLQIFGLQLPIPPALPLSPKLKAHLDRVRPVTWP